MSDVKFPLTPEQALARFDKEVERIQKDLQRQRDEIRRDLEVNTKAVRDTFDSVPSLLATSLAFLVREFIVTEDTKNKWLVEAHMTSGNRYGSPTSIREETVEPVSLRKGGLYRAMFILYPVT